MSGISKRWFDSLLNEALGHAIVRNSLLLLTVPHCSLLLLLLQHSLRDPADTR